MVYCSVSILVLWEVKRGGRREGEERGEERGERGEERKEGGRERTIYAKKSNTVE